MKKILLFLVGIFMLSTLQAQEVEKLYVGQNGTPNFIKFNTKNKAVALTDAQTVLKTYVFIQAGDEAKKVAVSQDKLGFTHEKYQQYYKGIKVEHGLYSVNKRGATIESMNGEYVFVKDNFRTSPVLSEDAALQKALQFVGAQKYMWQDAQNEAFAKQTEKAGTYFPKGELVIVQDFRTSEKDEYLKPVLAYKFDIYAEKPLSRDFIYVDAMTGKIVLKNQIIKHCFDFTHEHTAAKLVKTHKKEYSVNADATGSAATRYSGTRTITADSYNGSYRLREAGRGNGIETYDMNTGTNYSSAVDFTDNDNNWTAAEFDNTAKDNAALDAHWGAEMTYDYWLQKHNRNSYDNNGAAIKSYVHYDVAYDNAFWNGSVMTYGDGSDTYFDALTSLDVAAHEIGHAVCTNTANLTYSYESGAMNEGFSDIWAACVESFAAPEKSIWLIGEDIERRTGYAALRSMSDPKSLGQPDTYLGTNWATGSADNGGVHTNSGVLNHWFYILTVGKTGTNDNGNSYSVTGIGIDKAAAIAFRAESVYMTANSQYADARTAAIQSAEDLYGVGSNEVIQTTNAWYAVGVGAEYGSIAYCASKGNNSSYEWIAGVTIGAFTNTSGAAGYTDFTAQTVDLTSGQSYSVSLVPGFASTTYNEYWKIWIDFNKDGDFSDANELVFDAGALSNTTVTGTMNIPNVADVVTRMRVSMKYNAAQTECEAFSYGEVEDYTVNITAGTADTQAPSAPSNLTSANVTETTVDLSWTASTDNVGVTGYDVYKDGALYSTVTGTSVSVTGLTAATSYSFYVKAKDAAGNVSAASNTVNVTTNSAADTQAPTAPSNLTSANVTETTVDLSWTASTDNVGVTGYDVYKDGALYSTVTGTSTGVTGLTGSTTYSFYVVAKDAAGNVSAASNTVSITTQAPAGNCFKSDVTLSLTLDNYPSETSWDLKNSAGTTVASGSGYSTKGATVTQVFTLADDNYTFTIYDSYGDGICCSYGNGSYTLTDANGTVIKTGGSFTSSEATNFCISGSVTPPPDTGMPTGYCASKGNNSSYEWIDLVQLGTINNTSGNDGGYKDYTNLSTTLSAGTQYTVYFSAGFSGSSYTEFWQVWIDYNRDGDFADAGEQVATGSSSSSGTLSGTFTVPTTISTGTTKMRVTMKYNSAATSCESFTYGEVEDYAVNLTTAAFAGNTFNGIINADELGNEAQSFTIYPVPANKLLNIKVPAETDLGITIYNAMGAVVKTDILSGSTQIDVSDLAPGTYTLKIDDGNKQTLRKFIKK